VHTILLQKNFVLLIWEERNSGRYEHAHACRERARARRARNKSTSLHHYYYYRSLFYRYLQCTILEYRSIRAATSLRSNPPSISYAVARCHQARMRPAASSSAPGAPQLVYLFGLPAAGKVRRTPSWPRSWANFSLLYFYRCTPTGGTWDCMDQLAFFGP
jgi:hypothetical protein